MNLSEVRLSASALRHNLAALRTLVPSGAKVAAVVKGNAYGHGMREVVQILDGLVDYFQVDDLDELRLLRTVTQLPVLLLGYVPRDSVQEAVDLGAELAVYDTERLGEMRGARVHLKIDALLGRQGTLPSQVSEIVERIRTSGAELVGVYGHYANIEDTTDLGHAYAQRSVFDEAHALVEMAGYPGIARHLSATSGLMTMETPSTRPIDVVRLGVGLYGLYPSEALARTHASLDLKPAMQWVSHLAQVKTLPAGHPIGYGLTFVTDREMRIGIVPQGYSDGFARSLSNCGEVLAGGSHCRVLGRVAMNMFAIDLSSVPTAKSEDEVVLLGEQGPERITAEQVASQSDTINYEVTTRVSPLLPRIVKP